MQPNFKVFHRRAKRGGAPSLTIQKRGNATINEAAWEAIGRPTSITLLFDDDQHILGLQAAQPNSPDSYLVRPVTPNGSTRTFSIQALLNYYGIDVGQTRRYTPQILEGNILAVDLRSARQEDSSTATRRA